MGFVSRQHHQEVFVSSQCFFRKCTCVFYIPMYAYDYKLQTFKNYWVLYWKNTKKMLYFVHIFLDLIVFYFYNLNSSFDWDSKGVSTYSICQMTEEFGVFEMQKKFTSHLSIVQYTHSSLLYRYVTFSKSLHILDYFFWLKMNSIWCSQVFYFH